MTQTDRLLHRSTVLEIVGTSTPTLYRWMADGIFPRPVPTGPRSVRWSEQEVNDWIAAQKKKRAA